MSKKVLDVGQCNADHSRITNALSRFQVDLHRAHSHDEAMKLALDTPFDLILINRLLDADGSPGIDVLHSLKSQPALTETPVMIVSNFEDAQRNAVAEGAVVGFGKAAIDDPETSQLLAKYLDA